MTTKSTSGRSRDLVVGDVVYTDTQQARVVGLTQTNARDIAVLDMLHHGYHPPMPDDPNHDALMAQWVRRYRVRLACAAALLAAVAIIEQEEPPCPPSP